MDTNKNRPVRFRVSEREGQMLDALCERLGKKPSEMFRSLLTDKFTKVFPAYAMRKKDEKIAAIAEPQLTPEQACEKAGGKVDIVNGVPMCVFKIGKSMTSTVPLSSPELFKKYKQ